MALKGGARLASTEELLEAYAEWRTRSNGNPRLTKMVKGWDRVIHFVTTDTAQGYTMRVERTSSSPSSQSATRASPTSS